MGEKVFHGTNDDLYKNIGLDNGIKLVSCKKDILILHYLHTFPREKKNLYEN